MENKQISEEKDYSAIARSLFDGYMKNMEGKWSLDIPDDDWRETETLVQRLKKIKFNVR